MALLFAADRLDHHQNEIAPALARGEVVLCDRYVLSSLVYQGDALGDWPRALNEKAPAPDLTVLIEVGADLAATRRTARGGQVERYDDHALQARLAARYAELVAKNALRLDGARSPNELCDEICAAIIQRL